MHFREVIPCAQYEVCFLAGLLLLWIVKTKVGRRISSVAKIPVAYATVDSIACEHHKQRLFEAARSSNMNAVHRILDSLHRAGKLTEGTLASILRILISRKMTLDCLEIYTAYPMEDLPVLRIILACAVEECRAEQALEIFDKIGNMADLRDWNTIMRITRKPNFSPTPYATTLELLERMKKSSVEPTSNIYHFVFQVCIQYRHLDTAEELLPTLCDIGSYNALMRAYGDDRFKDSLRIFRMIKDVKIKPNSFTYDTILYACVFANETTLVRQIMEEMRQGGVELNTMQQAKLIKCMCRQRLIDDAMAMFGSIEVPDLASATSLIKALVDVQRLDEAYQLAHWLQSANIQLDEIVYNALLLGCAYSGNNVLAHDTLEHMQMNGISPSAATMSTLLKLYSKLQMWDDVVGVLQNLGKYGIPPEPRLFRQAVLGLCRRRQGHRILVVYNLFRVSMENTPDGIPKESNGEILSACANFSLLDTTRSLVGIMAKMNEVVPKKDLDLARDVLRRHPAGETAELFFEFAVLRRRIAMEGA